MEGRQCIAAGRSPYEEGSPLAHSQLTALGDRLSPGTTESLQRRPQHNEAIIRQRAMHPHLSLGAQDLLGLRPDPVDQGVTFYFSPSNPKQGQIVGACPLVESQLSVGQPTHPPPKQRNIYLTEIE